MKTERIEASGARRVVALYESDVDGLVSIDMAVEAARTAALLSTDGGVITGRVQVSGPAAWMRVLAGVIPPLDLMGYKQFHRVGQHCRYQIHLFRVSTGEQLAIVDGRRITSLRTAATAAVAAASVLPDKPFTIAIIGSGEEASEGLRTLASCLTLEDAYVYSPTPANREGFAKRLSTELGLVVSPTRSMAEALGQADIAYVATNVREHPIIRAEDVEHLTFLAAVGSTRPEQRELGGDVFNRAAAVVVDTLDACHEAGDLIEAFAQGLDSNKVATLGAVLRRDITLDSDLLVFKSVGTVEQDLVLASQLVDAAIRQGAGTDMDPVSSLRVMR